MFQTLKNIEIIFIDDGSTDNSAKILEKYAQKDSRITIITQTNQKQGAARNRGMEIAKGEFIGFVDSDDWVDLDFYEKLYNTAKEYNADIAYANFYSPGAPHRKKPYFEKIQEFLTPDDKIQYETINWMVWMRIYRRDKLIEHNIQFAEGVYWEDIGFTIRALYYLGKMVSVPGTLYYWRSRENSDTNSKLNKQKYIDRISAKWDLVQFIKEKKLRC